MGVQSSYIPAMSDGATIHSFAITFLETERDERRERYFSHTNPGGLTPPHQKAWEFEHFALQLLLEAAQMRLDAETEMDRLLRAERAA